MQATEQYGTTFSAVIHRFNIGDNLAV